MQCTVKGAKDKKSLSAIHHDKQKGTKQNLLDLILSQNKGIDNDEIYDIKTGETIRRIDDVSY